MSVEIKIVIPRKIYDAMVKCEKIKGIRKEDLIMMAMIKLLEELEVK
ncbi:MAG: hypothetical protein QXV82_09160 [Ignisphaera sp.]